MSKKRQSRKKNLYPVPAVSSHPATERKRAPSSPRGARFQTVNARYDAAQTTVRNARHWAMADNMAANFANSPEVRRILRSRSRYEEANNSYCDGIIDTLANWLLGPCPVLQMNSGDEEIDEVIELLFNKEWARAVNLGRKLKILHKARVRDGEGFVLLYNNARSPLVLQLDMMNFECDRVTDYGSGSYREMLQRFNLSAEIIGAADNIDGVIVDASGNPLLYMVLRQHPGDTVKDGVRPFESVPVPAEYVIHWYDEKRPEQKRGIPEMASALELFGVLRDYTHATLRAAQTAANFAMVLKTQGPVDDETGGYTPPENGEDAEPESVMPSPGDVFPLEIGMVTTLPAGHDINQTKPEQPTTTFPDFERRMINQVGRGRNMPFNIAAGNSEGYNYASGRLDHQSFGLALDVDRRDVKIMILDKILVHFWSELTMLPGFSDLPARLKAKIGRTLQINPIPDHDWMFAGVIHIDPNKVASAFTSLFDSAGTTLSDHYAAQGKDWRKEIKQWTREMEMIAEYQRKSAAGSVPAQNSNPDNGDDNDASDPIEE